MKLNQHELRERFSYDRGQLFHRSTGSPVPVSRTGDAVIDGIRIRHRDIVWVYHYGNIPEGKQVVHLNDDSDDAYIESLRLVEVEYEC